MWKNSNYLLEIDILEIAQFWGMFRGLIFDAQMPCRVRLNIYLLPFPYFSVFVYSGEPEWVEVVTELLLSLLSQSSHLVRVVVKNVFSLLIPHLTRTSLDVIFNVSLLTHSHSELLKKVLSATFMLLKITKEKSESSKNI